MNPFIMPEGAHCGANSPDLITYWSSPDALRPSMCCNCALQVARKRRGACSRCSKGFARGYVSRRALASMTTADKQVLLVNAY